MKNLKFIILFVIATTAILSCNNSDDSDIADPDPLEAYEELNVSYGNDSDQVFDLYLPYNRTSATKTIILVHGGGWTAGDKADMNDIVEIIQSQLPT